MRGREIALRLFLLLTVLSLYSTSCKEVDPSKVNNIHVGNYDLISVYEQKIQNSNKAIYSFDLEGNITGSTFNGITVLDTLNSFDKSNFDSRLPFSYLKSLPKKDTINVIQLIEPKDKYDIKIEPISIELIFKEDIIYKIEKREKYVGCASLDCFLESYTFESIECTKDSIHIFGLKSKFVDSNKEVKQLSFPKGNIELVEYDENVLQKLIVKELVEGIGDEVIYNKKSPNYGNERIDLKIVCIKPYYFEPRNKILIDSFSDYGFFKKKI